MFTPEIEKLIINQYVQDKIPATKIGKSLNCHHGKIYNILKKNGIKRRSVSESKTQYSFNRDFFQSIDSEEKAYWLGFLITDGCISIRDEIRQDLIIGLAEYDFNHLKKFVNSLNGNNYISRNKIETRIGIRSVKLCQDLLKLGIHPNKTFTVKPPILDDKFLVHFWRGCIDGDGSISFRANNCSCSVGFTGNHFMVQGFQSLLKKIFNYEVNITKDHSIFRIRVSGGKAYNIINYLYKNSIIYLDRKHEIYKQIINKLSFKYETISNK